MKWVGKWLGKAWKFLKGVNVTSAIKSIVKGKNDLIAGFKESGTQNQDNVTDFRKVG